MPRELKISVGQHSDKGRKETNQDFHGVLIPAEPLLEPEGHRHRAGGRHQQQQCQPGRREFGGQGISDRLLLHVGILVGADLGTARAGGDQFLAALADARSQYSYDKDKGYVCTLSAMVIKSTTGAHLSRRRQPDLSPFRQFAGAAHQRPSRRHFVGAELSRPRARRESADRNRLSDVQGREGRHLRPGHRRHLRACRRPRALQGRSRTARPISTQAAKAIVEHGLRSRQQGQSHRPDRPRRRIARRRRQRSVRAAARIAAAAAAWRRGRCSTATGSSANCTAPAAATSISPSISKPTPWSPSRSRRSICATIPPI